MARLGIDYETVKHAAAKLLSQGIAPSVQKIRELLGTGSNSTIADHLKVWRDEYAKKSVHHLPANMPKELISTFEVLWQTAMEHAENQLAEYKRAIDTKSEASLKSVEDAEKATADAKQNLADLVTRLEREISDKERIQSELSLANTRLITKDAEITDQKNQYEGRLKRVYEEKDGITLQYQQLQNEIKMLQEKIEVESKQHQNAIAQQNASHEQSENRWAKLIDQAREETKNTQKKLDKIDLESDAEIKKLKEKMDEFQQSLLEKSAQLKVSVQQVAELTQANKSLGVDLVSAKATVMKLEEDLKQKNDILAKASQNQEGDSKRQNKK